MMQETTDEARQGLSGGEIPLVSGSSAMVSSWRKFFKEQGVVVTDPDRSGCKLMTQDFPRDRPALRNEDIGGL